MYPCGWINKTNGSFHIQKIRLKIILVKKICIENLQLLLSLSKPFKNPFRHALWEIWSVNWWKLGGQKKRFCPLQFDEWKTTGEWMCGPRNKGTFEKALGCKLMFLSLPSLSSNQPICIASKKPWWIIFLNDFFSLLAFLSRKPNPDALLTILFLCSALSPKLTFLPVCHSLPYHPQISLCLPFLTALNHCCTLILHRWLEWHFVFCSSYYSILPPCQGLKPTFSSLLS